MNSQVVTPGDVSSKELANYLEILVSLTKNLGRL